MRPPARLLPALLLLAGLLAGCGGGSHSVTAKSARTGRATFVVRWPGRTARLIPIASNSIVVTLQRNGAQVATKILARPASGNETQATFDPLPLGDLIVVATAFPGADGTGTAQATGTAGLTVQPNANTTISLTMGSTITHVTVTPSPATLLFGSTQNGTATVAASAMDADNNVVLTSGSTYTWSTGNAAIASVTPNGSMALVTAVGAGSAQIISTESESNMTGQTQAKVRTPGTAVGTWSKFRADTANTGIGTGRVLGASTNWTAATGGPIESSAVLAQDGTVYVGSGDGNIYALTGQQGSVKWTSFLGGHIKSTPVLGADGTIFAASTGGQITAIEKADGSQKWSAFFGSSFTSSPTLGPDGTLYVASEDSTLRAIDSSTGDQIWAVSIGAAVESSPALSADGKVLYIGAGDRQMRAINKADGSQIWSFTVGGAIQSSPALDVQTNILYFGSDDSMVYALNALDGTPHWNAPATTGGIVSASPAIATIRGTKLIVVGSTDSNLYALDAATGMSASTPFTAGGAIRSSPAVDRSGLIVFGSDDGNIYGISLGSGTFNKSFMFSTGSGVVASPALDSNGNEYIGSTNSTIYSLGGG